MKVVWVYPVDKRDGISLYAGRYVAALKPLIAVESADVEECRKAGPALLQKLSECDVVHIQYEPSFFVRGSRDSYEPLCRRIRVPLVVTLHEVYDSFPGVFPRDRIRGNPITKQLKRSLYDYRHPALTRFSHHLAHGFWAHIVLVHHGYQKAVIANSGLPSHRIAVMAHPVPAIGTAPDGGSARDSITDVRMGATGFLNPGYDYDLLMRALEKLTVPWHFTWIGGIRRQEDTLVLRSLQQQIVKRGWEQRFTITGWVADEDQIRRLASLDLFLALFKHRSTSGSLAMAFAAGLPTIATSLPLTEALRSNAEMLLTSPPDAQQVADRIRALIDDCHLRQRLRKTAARYAADHSYENMARQMVQLYERFAADKA